MEEIDSLHHLEYISQDEISWSDSVAEVIEEFDEDIFPTEKKGKREEETINIIKPLKIIFYLSTTIYNHFEQFKPH